MTKEEITAKKETFSENELFKQSSSPYKDFQYEQFHIHGTPLEGQHSRMDVVNGTEMRVIFNFKHGLIHADGDLPAIEYPMHWEYWQNGLITKVVDEGGDTEEYWEDGVPVRIERNLSQRPPRLQTEPTRVGH